MKTKDKSEVVATVVATESKYSKPARPSWMPEDGIEVKGCETTAYAPLKGDAEGPQTPGVNPGSKFAYDGEMLTISGLAAFHANNPELLLHMVNAQIQYRSLAASAKLYGPGEYAFNWAAKPGDKGEKASKERAAFEAQLEALDVPKDKWAGAWEKYKASRKG